MKICPKCKNKNRDTAKRCDSCNYPFSVGIIQNIKNLLYNSFMEMKVSTILIIIAIIVVLSFFIWLTFLLFSIHWLFGIGWCIALFIGFILAANEW